MPRTIPVSATPSGVSSRTQDSNPPIFKSPNIMGSAFRVIGKVKSAMGVSSKKSASSKSKGTRRSAFISWGRARVPQMVSFAPSTALVCKTKSDSRLSPDDSVTFTHEDDTVARPTPTGDVQTSPDGEATSDVTVSHANKVLSEVQTGHDGQTRLTPDLLVERLLTKPKAPISQPDPHPPPAPGSIEGISSITHASSSDATSSNSTLPFLGPPSPQDGPALKVGELPAAALKKPPTHPSSPSTPPVNPKPAPPPPGPKPPLSAPKGIDCTGNVAPTSNPPPLAPKGTESTGNIATTPRFGKTWGLLPLASPDASASGLTQTAAQKQVESLVRGMPGSTQGPIVVPPGRSTNNDSSFYWVGSLPSQVEQTLPPKFTPRPNQLFLKILIDIFGALMKEQTREDQRKAHATLHVITLILADGKEAASWFNFHECKSEEVTHLIMTYGVCSLTRGDVNIGHNLPLFILAIEGVIRTMITLSDCTGESFAMDISTRPRVSYTDIIKRTEDHATKRRLDLEGMQLMEFRIQTIISTVGLLGEDFQRMLTPDWWLLDCKHLIAQPKEMLFQVYFEKEREDLLRNKHTLEDREAAFQQKQEDSAVNSANYSRRDDSVVTPPQHARKQGLPDCLGPSRDNSASWIHQHAHP